MIIYFADRRMNILGMASTKIKKGLRISDDTKVEDVETGVASLELWMAFESDERSDIENMAAVGNYILRKNGDADEFYTIIDSELNVENHEMYMYCEDAGLDLLNEIVGAYTADQAYSVEYYIEKFAYDSGFEVGINEISNLTRTLSWEGEATATERIDSVATQFDNAEISYSFEVENLAVTHKYINIHKQRGDDSGIKLRLNKEINNITIKKSIANLATALSVSGGIPEGEENPITLNGYTYDDGDFYVDGTVLKSRNALELWSRYIWPDEPQKEDDEGHIVKTYSYDTTSQSELCNRAVSELKEACEIEVNYEVDIAMMPDGVKLGDTIDIVDKEGELYLSARILKLETSETQQSVKATIGDYLIKDSGIDSRLEQLAAEFAETAKAKYIWVAYANSATGSGISTSPSNKTYMGIAVNRSTSTVDISDPSIFTWQRTKGNTGATGATGESGEDAILLYIDSSNGNSFKNSSVETVLSVTIIIGETTINTPEDLASTLGDTAVLSWSEKQYGATAFTPIDSSDKRLVDSGFYLVVSPSDVDTKTIFQCDLEV